MLNGSDDRTAHPGEVDVEFSLALNNRTGKYFVCRDMITALSGSVRHVVYWRINAQETPQGLYARVLGRLMTEEFKARTQWPAFARLAPQLKSPRPIIFTDPLQVLFHRLKPSDGVICHDMGPITHPQYYARGVERSYQLAFEQISRVRPRIAFVSRGSMLAYEDLYGAAHSRSTVVYPAIRNEVTSGAVTPMESVRKPFLLMVGAIGTRKNQVGAIKAFDATGMANRGYVFVIAGGPEPGYEEASRAAAANSSVITPGYVDDAQLRWLYSNAEGFVLPSYLEGFGFPAAEAALRGLVPVIGRGGALEEIAGPGAILVDPDDTPSIASGMLQVVSLSPEERETRLQQLKAHVGQFTEAAAQSGWRAAFLD